MKFNLSSLSKSPNRALLPLAVGLSLLLSGCADSTSSTSCTQKLDESDFVTVSEDTSCSTYERASAYMGRAGFLFTNFLADGASDNFNTALGIPSSATDWDTWDGKTYYEAARTLSGDGTGDTYEGKTRSTPDIEIHFFATLGYLLAETYIKLDADKNGTISESETQSFTKLRSSSDTANYGSNDISTSNYLQFVKDGTTPYLIDTSKTTANCWSDTNYDGIEGLNGTTGSNMDTCGIVTTAELAAGATVSGTCAVVATVNDVQNMFTATISTGSAVLTLTDSIVSAINSLDADSNSLGLPSDSDLREGLSDFTTKIDNGGACTSNATYAEVNQLLTLIDSANSSAITSYASTNKIKASSLTTASDKSVTVPTAFSAGTVTFSCTNSADLDARLVFQKSDNATYTPDYGSAKSGISTTFSSLVNIRLDATGATKPTVKGDNKISFEELICMQ
ncbi:MAG: hypothetical protein RRB13_07930 [bacterium]|nr:hypothetical protein [bacterium]